MREYQSIPVDAAKHLATFFDKDIVIIVAWNHEHKQFHTVTYGKLATDKVSAARGGEIATKALGGALEKSVMFEDFRTDYDAGRQKAMLEAIQKHLPALKSMAGQVIHPAENTFSRMVKDLEAAIK